MIQKKNRFKSILLWLMIIAIDLFIFLIIGLLLMGYDDHYDSSKGEYWSLASMNTTEKIIYFFYNAWTFLNMVALIYIGFKIYRRKKWK
jgi:hypothetical protein